MCLDLEAALYANSYSLDAMMNILKTHLEKAADALTDTSVRTFLAK